MPRKRLATATIATFPLRKPGDSGLRELDKFLSELRASNVIIMPRRHIGYVDHEEKNNFKIEFEFDEDAAKAAIRW
jgi:hypothetical protein